MKKGEVESLLHTQKVFVSCNHLCGDGDEFCVQEVDKVFESLFWEMREETRILDVKMKRLEGVENILICFDTTLSD